MNNFHFKRVRNFKIKTGINLQNNNNKGTEFKNSIDGICPDLTHGVKQCIARNLPECSTESICTMKIHGEWIGKGLMPSRSSQRCKEMHNSELKLRRLEERCSMNLHMESTLRINNGKAILRLTIIKLQNMKKKMFIATREKGQIVYKGTIVRKTVELLTSSNRLRKTMEVYLQLDEKN